MNVCVIVAGTNEPSNCGMLTEAFIRGVEKDEKVAKGAKVMRVRLRDLSIEHFKLSHYNTENVDEEDFGNVRRMIQEADGIVIATPVWNFGVPAHLKNLIDRMGEFALDESRSKGVLGGKPVYLIFTGGAPGVAWKGLMRRTTSFVPESLKYFGASIIGMHFEGRCTLGKGQFGLVVDKRPASLKTMRSRGEEFAVVVREYAETGKLPAKQAMLRRVYAFGQGMVKKWI